MNNKEDWKTAEIVFGKLRKIDREHRRVGIELKEIDPDSERWIWVPHYYKVSEDFSSKGYETLLEHLDSDIKIKLIDGQVTEILTT